MSTLEVLKQRAKDKGLAWVPGEGPANAKIMVVGEAPGEQEVRALRPFCGGAGWLLDNVLKSANVQRTECYITNVVKVRPPKNDLKRLGEVGFEFGEFLPSLREEIEQVHPNIVVALGGHALRALTPYKSITQWRGSIIESSLVPGQKVVPTVHPAAVLRQYKWKPLLMLDMKRVREESSKPTIELPKRTLVISPSLNQLKTHIETFLDKAEYIACDIEVDRMGMMSCISFSSDPLLSISIPLRNGYNSYWSEGEEFTIWRWLSNLFHGEHKWIFQNALFDLKWIVPRVGWFEIWMDTMICHQLCYAEIPKGLDTLASIYTKEPYYKDERKVWKDTTITKQLWLYNAKDSAVTVEVALRLLRELQQLKMEDFFFGYVMKLMPLLLKMEMRGMRVDLEKREEVRRDLEVREKELEGALGGINVRSSKQVQELLYTKMGLPKQYDHKKGTVTAGKKALEKLREKM